MSPTPTRQAQPEPPPRRPATRHRCRIGPYLDQGGPAARDRWPGASAALCAWGARTPHAGPHPAAKPHDQTGASSRTRAQALSRPPRLRLASSRATASSVPLGLHPADDRTASTAAVKGSNMFSPSTQHAPNRRAAPWHPLSLSGPVHLGSRTRPSH